MNITRLKQVVKQNLKEQGANRKTLSITGDFLESPTLAKLFQDYLETDTLAITHIQSPIEHPDSIAVVGQSSHPLFSDMLLTAEFSIKDAAVILLITAQATPNWNLTVSFPALKNSLFQRINFGEEAVLILASEAAIASEIPAGLFFQGTLQLTAILGLMTWFFGGETELPIQGSIQLESGQPVIQLLTPVSNQRFELGFLSLPMPQIEILSTVTPATEQQPTKVEAVVNLHSQVEFETTAGNLSLPLNAVSYLNSPYIQFSTELEDLLDTSFESLTRLANGLNLSQALPAQFELQEQLKFVGLAMQIDLSNRRLENIFIGLETQQSWPLLEDVLTLESLAFSFSLVYPFKAEQLSMMLTGEIGIEV